VDSFDWEYTEKLKERTEPEVATEEFEIITAEITAYTSRPEETSGDPCISASQVNLCYNTIADIHKLGITEDRISVFGIVACPQKYPFGTIIGIPKKLEGGLSYYSPHICLDRMNFRYEEATPERFDIYFGSDLEGALEFGRQTLPVKIYK
ncbi:MAG: hypothetical protein U9P63_02570, partial [Patescibacteria group bacterium]|nr:hypothetical protein [Patescibacteria group bacterium]